MRGLLTGYSFLCSFLLRVKCSVPIILIFMVCDSEFFSKDFSVLTDQELCFWLNISQPLTRLDRTSDEVADRVRLPKVQGCWARITFIYQYQTNGSQVDVLEKHTGKVFRVDCFPQSLRTRAIQMKIKILKIFCRGNRAATLVSCLSLILFTS